MKRIRLNQHAIEIQLTQKLLENETIIILTRSVADLHDRRTQGRSVQRHLGDER